MNYNMLATTLPQNFVLDSITKEQPEEVWKGSTQHYTYVSFIFCQTDHNGISDCMVKRMEQVN